MTSSSYFCFLSLHQPSGGIEGGISVMKRVGEGLGELDRCLLVCYNNCHPCPMKGQSCHMATKNILKTGWGRRKIFAEF